jgi:putative oxidoreductase
LVLLAKRDSKRSPRKRGSLAVSYQRSAIRKNSVGTACAWLSAMSATSPKQFGSSFGDTDDVAGRSRSHAVDQPRSWVHRLVETDNAIHSTIARLALGLVMLPHALQKSVGLFGGQGFNGTYDSFTSNGTPGILVLLLIVGELLGSLSLIFGALTRIGAVAIISIMVGAIAMMHAQHGFFMNWWGSKQGEGFEYHLLAIGLGIVALIAGGGKASVDRLIMKWRTAEGGSVSPALTGTP